mmetsp:Transcript_14086/g.16379  ORF Transcript_14086/g.16379 Transcript_14086/m.16379 type:complete len:378 (+) Transcript_14086:50-1183(+)
MKHFILFILSCLIQASNCFLPHQLKTKSFSQRTNNGDKKHPELLTPSSSCLFGGVGITSNYTWKEDQFEIEIKLKVPSETRAKHVIYKPKSRSMELSLEMNENKSIILLHGDRQFRGMVDLDGTFWSLIDSENGEGREIIVTIEKLIVPPNDPFEVVEYDWGSVYLNDDDEILSKEYAEAETLDIREYAASLGVDIDNINMTMVDKNMFASGLNMTKNTVEQLTKQGYVKEITRQGDGLEFIEEGVGEDRKSVPFNSLGDNVGADELEDAGIGRNSKVPIPFLDKESPWRHSMPVEEARGVDNVPTVDGSEQQICDITDTTNEEKSPDAPPKYQDPVDRLTVEKLKGILRKEGLKVTGNKKELRERLKDHVASKMNR